MNEKELIVGKPSKKLQLMLFYIGLAFLALFVLTYLLNIGHVRTGFSFGGGTVWKPSILNIMIFDIGSIILSSITLDLGIICLLIGAILYVSLAKVAITVTDKRVFGTTSWGKRVDLPLDSISAVSTSAFKGIAVASSSGMIKFKTIENNREVHKVISRLLVERQKKTNPEHRPSETIQAPQSNADELKKFKELLDCGIITQEEFNAKKKQLLGL